MTFDWPDFFRTFNPLTIASTVVVGLVIGYTMFHWMIARQRAVEFLLMSGTAWAATLMVARIGEGSPIWEAYLGAMCLWWIFCVAVFVGQRIAPYHF